jgi:hypothetical protein
MSDTGLQTAGVQPPAAKKNTSDWTPERRAAQAKRMKKLNRYARKPTTKALGPEGYTCLTCGLKVSDGNYHQRNNKGHRVVRNDKLKAVSAGSKHREIPDSRYKVSGRKIGMALTRVAASTIAVQPERIQLRKKAIRLLAKGWSIPQLHKKLGVSSSGLHYWKAVAIKKGELNGDASERERQNERNGIVPISHSAEEAPQHHGQEIDIEFEGAITFAVGYSSSWLTSYANSLDLSPRLVARRVGELLLRKAGR